MAQASRSERLAARLVAVGAAAVGTLVLVAMALADTVRGRHGPPPPRNI